MILIFTLWHTWSAISFENSFETHNSYAFFRWAKLLSHVPDSFWTCINFVKIFKVPLLYSIIWWYFPGGTMFWTAIHTNSLWRVPAMCVAITMRSRSTMNSQSQLVMCRRFRLEAAPPHTGRLLLSSRCALQRCHLQQALWAASPTSRRCCRQRSQPVRPINRHYWACS